MEYLIGIYFSLTLYVLLSQVKRSTIIIAVLKSLSSVHVWNWKWKIWIRIPESALVSPSSALSPSPLLTTHSFLKTNIGFWIWLIRDFFHFPKPQTAAGLTFQLQLLLLNPTQQVYVLWMYVCMSFLIYRTEYWVSPTEILVLSAFPRLLLTRFR